MHIPDGMLSTTVAVATDVGAVGAIGYGVSWVNRNLNQRKVVLMSVLGALIFALQMLNFSVAAGTSGHFAGGAMAGIILGPWPATIIMTAVLGVQALLFKDGGVVALGANVLNMAIIAPFVGYAIHKLIVKMLSRRTPRTAQLSGAFVAAWCSTVLAALAVGVELWLSGRANLTLALGSMGIWHAIIGIGEGIITAGLIGYLMTVRPDILGDTEHPAKSSMRSVTATLIILAVVGAGLSFLASGNPDGLEFVYFDQGVGKQFAEFSLLGEGGPLAGYGVAGISNEVLGSALAGIIGLALTGLALYVVFRKKNTPTEGGS